MKIKRSLLISCLLLMSSLFSLDDSTDFFSQIITKDQIKSSGIVRISEILLLVDDSRIISHEGFTWKASINVLSTYQNQNWQIMIDNKTYNRTIFDVNNLNMLPITLNEISYVEVKSYPDISKSGIESNGVIHFHSDRSKIDSIGGYVVIGSETNDAGPYITVSGNNSPNVDKTGPILSARINHNFDDLQVIASFIGQSHNFSDSKLRYRNAYTITDGETWAGIKRISPSLLISKNSETFNHELYADFSYTDKYPFYLESLGREIPTYSTFGEIGYKLEKALNSKQKLSADIQYSNSKLEKYPNIYDFGFDWNLHKLSSNIELQQKSIIDRIGIYIEYDKLDSEYALDKNDFTTFNIYCNSRYVINEKLEIKSIIEFDTNLEYFVPKTSLQQVYSFNDKSKILSVFTFTKELPEENENLLFWVNNGYNLLEDNGYIYEYDNHFKGKSKITYDLIYKNESNKFLHIYLNGFFRAFNNLNLENQMFTFNETTYSFDSPIEVVPNIDGNMMGLNFKLSQKFNDIINHKLYFSHQKAVNGDDLFISEWNKIPTSKLTYQCNLTLFDDLEIGLFFNYFSKTTWDNYDLIEGESYNINSQKISYSSSVNAIKFTNLKISKKFINDKLSGSLILQNLFNQNYSYHPIGASFDLTYFIILSFDF